jgi:hypothetical protein
MKSPGIIVAIGVLQPMRSSAGLDWFASEARYMAQAAHRWALVVLAPKKSVVEGSTGMLDSTLARPYPFDQVDSL